MSCWMEYVEPFIKKVAYWVKKTACKICTCYYAKRCNAKKCNVESVIKMLISIRQSYA